MKVYVTGYWEDDQSLFETIKKYAFGGTSWKNLEFTMNTGFDKAVILNHCNANSLHIPQGKAIAFRLEPPGSSHHLQNSSTPVAPGYLHWPLWHKFSKNDLQPLYQTDLIKKTNLFSTVTSDLGYLDGHFERLIMIHFLDSSITDGFDVFGRRGSNRYFDNIKAYKGELINKYDGLLDYQYHLAIENSFLRDYYTEKISDPILAESLCFYDGCTNLEEYIDERAFYRIDISRKWEAKEAIIKAIRDNEYGKRVKFIKKQKKRLLTDLNPLNLIWLAVNEFDYEKRIKL